MGDTIGAYTIGDYCLIALVGFALVFAVLIILMLIIQLTSLVIKKSPALSEKIKSKKGAAGASAAETGEEDTALPDYAGGSCGELLLVNTTERDAAMMMAIIANELDTPLNELRFQSIKRIDEEGEPK